MDVALGRKPRTKVDELNDPCRTDEIADGSTNELPVDPSDLAPIGSADRPARFVQFVSDDSISLEVVLAMELPVPDPSNVRDRQVDRVDRLLTVVIRPSEPSISRVDPLVLGRVMRSMN
jgi:hypothetical protein